MKVKLGNFLCLINELKLKDVNLVQVAAGICGMMLHTKNQVSTFNFLQK